MAVDFFLAALGLASGLGGRLGRGQLGGQRLVGGSLLGGGLLGGGLLGLLGVLGLLGLGLLGLLGILGRALAAEGDVGDAERGQLGAEPLLDARARLGLVLEDDDLLAAVLAQDLGRDAGAVHDRLADGGFVAVRDQQDAIERDGVAGLDVQAIDLDLRAELDAVLLAA